MNICWWSLAKDGPMALPTDVAAEWWCRDTPPHPVFLGSYEDAAATYQAEIADSLFTEAA